IGILQRVGPALAGAAARAAGGEFAPIAEGVREFGVGAAADRYCLRDVLAGIAIGIEHGFRGRAHALARALVVGEVIGDRRIGDREEIAVAGAHTDRAVSAGRAAIPARIDDAAQDRLKEIAWSRLRRGTGVLCAAIVLRQLCNDAATLAFAVAAAALEPFQIAHHAVEIAADLLNLRVERLAVLRLASEQGEEPGDPLTAGTVRLRHQAVEVRLLLGDGLFGVADEIGAPW